MQTMQTNSFNLPTCVASIALAIALLTTAQPVQACGESLFHVGKGVIFRNYAAPLPGKILVVARTEGELMMAERLAAAGHDVHVIADSSQIGTELSAAKFDVVLALFKERQIVEAQMRNIASTSTYLPVAAAGTEEESAARAVARHSLSTDDTVKSFLKAIHRKLKAART